MTFLPSRRSALRSFAGISALVLGASACGPADPGVSAAAGGARPDGGHGGERRLGAEWESHTRTFMSWPALESVWMEDLPYVRKDIARIAREVA
ncbi:agmatine deiminase family protein, partial [Streptomyces massasporeus]